MPSAFVMPAHSRPKDGVLSHAYVAGIRLFRQCAEQDVSGRDKPGHDNKPMATRDGAGPTISIADHWESAVGSLRLAHPTVYKE